MNKLMMTVTVRATLPVALLCCKTTRFAQEKWVLCRPVETVSFSGRVHVKCETPVDGVFWYFACSTADARFSSRMLNVSMAGQVAEKTLLILFDPNDQSGVTFGCLANDCRTARAIGITEAAAPIVVAPEPPTPPSSTSETGTACKTKCQTEFAVCKRDGKSLAFCTNLKTICLENCGP